MIVLSNRHFIVSIRRDREQAQEANMLWKRFLVLLMSWAWLKTTKQLKRSEPWKEVSGMLSNDSARACYGTKHVEVAHEEYIATLTLLITDKLIYQQGGSLPTWLNRWRILGALLLYFFCPCTFQESNWRCILPLLQSFDFLCQILRILTCNKKSSRPQV